MTPDKARRLLEGTTPGPWFFDDDMDGRMRKIGPIVPSGTELDCTTDDAALAAYAPEMAAMIAGMREEWGVVWPADHASPEWTAWGFHSAEEACEHITSMSVPDKPSPDTRIVRRYTTEPEEA